MYSKFYKNLSIVALSFGLVACFKDPIPLGPDSPDEWLQGTQERIELFETLSNENPKFGNHLTIHSNGLKSGEDYSYYGSLTVNGDIPEDVDIYLEHGKFVLNGNLGEGSEVKVKLQEEFHTLRETAYRETLWADESTSCYILPEIQPLACEKYIKVTRFAVGLEYRHDTDPAIDINGHAGKKTRLIANAGVEVDSHHKKAKIKTGWDRPTVVHQTGQNSF